MNPNDPNVILLEFVAGRLGEQLRQTMVFVGGAVAGLLVTDPAMPAIRATEDVDLIVQVAALTDYHRLEQSLRDSGFTQDPSPDAPICRWRVGPALVDVMPTLESILGFSNRWYPLALESAVSTTLPSGLHIKLISAPVFIATKLEAFAGRGEGDYLFSHDLGDVIAVIDGRDSLIAECHGTDLALRRYLRERFAQLLANRRFREALPGYLLTDPGSQARLPDLLQKLQALGALR